MNNWLKRLLKISGISLGALVIIIFLLPEIFPGFISKKIKTWANESITGELNFSKARLSLLRHFPSLTLSLYDFSLQGSEPFKKDTLLAGKELAFGLDLRSIFKTKLNISEFYLNEALIEIKVDAAGGANYNIYKPSGSHAGPSDSNTAALKIEKIIIKNCKLIYNDQSVPMLIDASGFNYTGKGDLSKAVFDLHSVLKAEHLNFYFNGTQYIQNKKINANLLTKINANSLALTFEKNDLLINQLPVNFKGSFNFLKTGYAMDLRFNSGHTNLYDVFTVLPPSYLTWLGETEMKGDASIAASLIGNYVPSSNNNTGTYPNLVFNMQVNNGFINHAKAPASLANLLLRFETRLPGLNPDSLIVNLDTLAFNIGKDYLHASYYSNGINHLEIKANAESEMDLEKLDRVLGFSLFDIKGKSKLNLIANGLFTTGIDTKKLRPDTIITSIPVFDITFSVQNGYLKYTALPADVQNIQLHFAARCKSNDYHQTSIAIDSIHATLLKSFINGYARLKNLKDYSLDANIKSNIKLEELKQALPIKDIDLAGDLLFNIEANGNYVAAKKIFPKIIANIQLKDGMLKTSYYPQPITKIQINATAIDNKANMDDLNVRIEPLSFSFEEQTFKINASLNNFNNPVYHVAATGTLDLEKIYKVFKQDGIGLTGLLEANLTLSGRQSDATSGHYERLHNSGILRMKNIRLSYDAYPKPFVIGTGLLRFKQDKIWLEAINANYGRNQFLMNGYFENIANYVLQNKPLTGNLDLISDKIITDDFMFYADTTTTPTQQNTSTGTGVVLVPDNLSLTFTTTAKTVLYNDLTIKDLKGKLVLDSGIIKLVDTQLRLADANVKTNAAYKSLSPVKASFDCTIHADSFDIKKAYNEIRLFRDLASSAAKASGIVSLDYTMKGNLDSNMYPIYPSLKGGGILSLENIKVNGLKLFSAISKTSGKDSVNNPNLKKVKIKTNIANNIISIDRVRMKVFGFRPRFEGQTSFDGKLNLKCRLGLPPFGLIGIPMSITGTSNNPIVRLKKNEEADLEETNDEEE